MRPKIVMVAEDETLIRMLAVEFLMEAGFEAIEAACAEEALALLGARAHEISLLFTDVNMPGAMDGLRLAHHVRLAWPRIGLLICSGRGRPGSDEMPAGSRFLSKPYEPSQMVDHARMLTSAW